MRIKEFASADGTDRETEYWLVGMCIPAGRAESYQIKELLFGQDIRTNEYIHGDRSMRMSHDREKLVVPKESIILMLIQNV